MLSKVDYADKKEIERCVAAAAEAVRELVAGADIMRVEEKINRKK